MSRRTLSGTPRESRCASRSRSRTQRRRWLRRRGCVRTRVTAAEPGIRLEGEAVAGREIPPDARGFDAELRGDRARGCARRAGARSARAAVPPTAAPGCPRAAGTGGTGGSRRTPRPWRCRRTPRSRASACGPGTRAGRRCRWCGRPGRRRRRRRRRSAGRRVPSPRARASARAGVLKSRWKPRMTWWLTASCADHRPGRKIARDRKNDIEFRPARRRRLRRKINAPPMPSMLLWTSGVRCVVLGGLFAAALAVSMAGQQPTRVDPEAAGLSRARLREATDLLTDPWSNGGSPGQWRPLRDAGTSATWKPWGFRRSAAPDADDGAFAVSHLLDDQAGHRGGGDDAARGGPLQSRRSRCPDSSQSSERSPSSARRARQRVHPRDRLRFETSSCTLQVSSPGRPRFTAASRCARVPSPWRSSSPTWCVCR